MCDLLTLSIACQHAVLFVDPGCPKMDPLRNGRTTMDTLIWNHGKRTSVWRTARQNEMLHFPSQASFLKSLCAKSTRSNCPKFVSSHYVSATFNSCVGLVFSGFFFTAANHFPPEKFLLSCNLETKTAQHINSVLYAGCFFGSCFRP